MKLLMITALPALLCFWCGCGRSTATGEPEDSTLDEAPDEALGEARAEEGDPDPPETPDAAGDDAAEDAAGDATEWAEEDIQDAPEEPAAPAATPPMGWNSWNRFGCDVDETMIREMAFAMVESGMRDAGYRYVNVDDCWQTDRAADGTIVADPVRFPGGMAALADYVHAMGLSFGVYTCAGSLTCQERPGSLDHELQDALTYAGWGVDYIKEDWCHALLMDPSTQYAIMRDAIAATGREMVFSICNWGLGQPWVWGPDTGQLWRTTMDISDSWASMTSILDQSSIYAAFAGPGHWNDPDMLEVGNGGMTDEEYRSHFSLWAVMAAPLIAGNDLRTMSDEIRSILMNPEVIAVDQDPAGIQGVRIWTDGAGLEVWGRPLAAEGERSVVLFNRTAEDRDIAVSWSGLGLGPGSAAVRDLWAQGDLGTFSGGFTASVPSHGVAMLKVTGFELDPPPGETYISDIPWKHAAGSWGPVERDMSNGEAAQGDGRTITLDGAAYGKGLGVNAASLILIHLDERCTSFVSDVGVDDEVGILGSVVFQVWADGSMLYDSGTVTGSSPALSVLLDLTGRRELALFVGAAGDSMDFDHADWAGARIVCP